MRPLRLLLPKHKACKCLSLCCHHATLLFLSTSHIPQPCEASGNRHRLPVRTCARHTALLYTCAIIGIVFPMPAQAVIQGHAPVASVRQSVSKRMSRISRGPWLMLTLLKCTGPFQHAHMRDQTSLLSPAGRHRSAVVRRPTTVDRESIHNWVHAMMVIGRLSSCPQHVHACAYR